jgi:hypothetical protein
VRNRPNVDRLRAAAKRRHSRGPWADPEEQRRAERRAEAEILALLEAIENGEPLPSRSYPRPPVESDLSEVEEFLDERRVAIATATAMLREAGFEDPGLRPTSDETGDWSDGEDEPDA